MVGDTDRTHGFKVGLHNSIGGWAQHAKPVPPAKDVAHSISCSPAISR
jgi:hypothetical protein